MKTRWIPRSLSRAVVVGAGLCVLAAAGSARAQSDYDANALRHKVGFWSAKLVAGAEERPLSGDVSALMRERSEEAADLYGKYRSCKTSGTVLWLVGWAALIGSIVAVDQDSNANNGLPGALLAGGLALTMGGSVQMVHAQDYLNRAIWTYNRTLAGTTP